ncbi:hypothetical protein KOW79_021031 [Hemibagrus wyckioides]|uniref:Uncharacterized protein n=1 Tax=Hemibagrus wyckioides TaxID=337641 RepID=A0A9D3N5T0_9TELE|nr:hypothetical protein KOW79_021031 [Hemibagrus wyckioides]
MEPTAADTIQQLVSALQEITASQPTAAADSTASQPAVAADSTVAACPPPNPEVACSADPMATPSLYSGLAEDCSGFLLQCPDVVKFMRK